MLISVKYEKLHLLKIIEIPMVHKNDSCHLYIFC